MLNCIDDYAKETGCIAECPCKDDDSSMYCWGLDYCHGEGMDMTKDLL